jgi:peptidoglycan/xylan/chitin deacetylase (PgdA/CDA1 family)
MTNWLQYAYSVSAFLLDRVPVARTLLGTRSGLRIVYYHRVNARTVPYYFSGDISPSVLDRQLDHIQRVFKVISLNEALSRMHQGQDLSGYACITFDDGFRECYTHVYPALQQRKLKATFFLIEDCLNNQSLMWRNKVLSVQNFASAERLAELLADSTYQTQAGNYSDLMSLSWQWPMDQKDALADQLWNAAQMPKLQSFIDDHVPYMTDDEVREMMDGGQEIGVHTRTHPVCSRLTEQQVDDEIIGSWKRLSERFDTPITAFSYPFGDRCSAEMEQRILAHTDMQIILGIRDSLANSDNAALWERRNMETGYDESISLFYLGPWKRRLAQSRAR